MRVFFRFCIVESLGWSPPCNPIPFPPSLPYNGKSLFRNRPLAGIEFNNLNLANQSGFAKIADQKILEKFKSVFGCE